MTTEREDVESQDQARPDDGRDDERQFGSADAQEEEPDPNAKPPEGDED